MNEQTYLHPLHTGGPNGTGDGKLIAEEFLLYAEHSGAKRSNGYHSYALKHLVESLYKSYVSNDDILNACRKYKLPVEYDKYNNCSGVPNGTIGITLQETYCLCAAVLIHHYGDGAPQAWRELQQSNDCYFDSKSTHSRRIRKYFDGDLNLNTDFNQRVVERIEEIATQFNNVK